MTEAECNYKYLSQPPSAIDHCDPYSNHIVLECTVRKKPGAAEFEIRWYAEETYITGTVVDLGSGYDPAANNGPGGLDRTSRYEFQSPYEPAKYWCLVIKMGDIDQPLMKSNVFTLLAPEEYTA